MRRPFKSSADYRVQKGHPELDFTQEQFAGIGRVAMAFNEVEDQLFALFSESIGIYGQMAAQISSRINGIDGVLAIIIAGARRIALNEAEMARLGETLGEGVFKRLKKCRDSVIHAVSHNAPEGIALQRERQGKFNEVLMTAEALDRLYQHLMALRAELDAAHVVLVYHRHVKSLADDDPDKASHEADRAEYSAQFLDHRNQRQSLPPLPEFPEESVLLSSREQWLSQIRWPKELPEE